MGYSQSQTRLAVVPLPAEIDITNSRQVGSDLRAAFPPGVRLVIADMTATTFCDSSGVRMLALAYQQATAEQARLALVVPSAAAHPGDDRPGPAVAGLPEPGRGAVRRI